MQHEHVEKGCVHMHINFARKIQKYLTCVKIQSV
jgi:hypothetical protein